MKMTERECALLAFDHQETPWVPSPSTSMDICIPTVIEVPVATVSQLTGLG